MSRHTNTLIAILALLAILSGCVATQTGGGKDLSAAAYNRQPNNDIVDLDSQTVIAATILQMMNRDTSQAPVVWAKGGDFKAAFDGFTYEGFGVTGVDVFDQQQAPDGKVTVQALVRLHHRSGARAANALQAVYSFAKDGRPVIHKTLAGPIPSRDPELEVLAVPSDKVAREKVFREKNYPGWLAAARRLAVPLPAKDKAKVHIFAFAKDRVLAGANLQIEANGKRSGKAVCIDDFGFAACVVAGEIAGQKNKAVLYLNGRFASSAVIK